MGSDEKKTFDILEKNRKIHKPIISEYNGRWIKELGDGVMASFSLVSDAVHAAIKIMEACNAANEYQLCQNIALFNEVLDTANGSLLEGLTNIQVSEFLDFYLNLKDATPLIVGFPHFSNF